MGLEVCMSIINRIKEKVLLWVRFFQLAENFWSIWIQRGFATFGLARVFNLDSTIRLKNGVHLAQDKVVDVSAVPVVVEIWGTQPYILNKGSRLSRMTQCSI